MDTFQNQIHHRGQVHAILADTEVKPNPLDELFLGSKEELALRRVDFDTTGFDETSARREWSGRTEPVLL